MTFRLTEQAEKDVIQIYRYTAEAFGHWVGTDPQFWLNLPTQFELAVADKETGEAIRHLPTKDSLLPQGRAAGTGIIAQPT